MTFLYINLDIRTFGLNFFSEIFLGLLIMNSVFFVAFGIKNLRKSPHHFLYRQKLYKSWANLFIFLSLIMFQLVFFSDLPSQTTFYFLSNEYTKFFQMLVLFITAFVIQHTSQNNRFTGPKLLLEYRIRRPLRIWFLVLLISANHFLTVFLCLIGFSTNLYVLIMLFDTSFRKPLLHEASIKYFYLSTFSSTFLLISFTLAFILTRTWNFPERSFFFHFFEPYLFPGFERPALLLFMLLTLVLGFTFKLAAFPSNFWAPEVYEGSAVQIAVLIILPVKIACLSLFARLIVCRFSSRQERWTPRIILAAIGSLIVGAWGAFTEKKFKRFIAYSSINQMGFMLLSLLGGTTSGLQNLIIFLTIYAVTNILLFSFIFRIEHNTNKNKIVLLSDFTQLRFQYLELRIVLSVVFFSLAGIPPFAGFFSKFYILLHTFNQGFYFTLFVGILTSLVSAYYYLRRVKLLWFETAITLTNKLTSFVGKNLQFRAVPKNFIVETTPFFWNFVNYIILFFLTFFPFFITSFSSFTEILAISCKF